MYDDQIADAVKWHAKWQRTTVIFLTTVLIFIAALSVLFLGPGAALIISAVVFFLFRFHTKTTLKLETGVTWPIYLAIMLILMALIVLSILIGWDQPLINLFTGA